MREREKEGERERDAGHRQRWRYNPAVSGEVKSKWKCRGCHWPWATRGRTFHLCVWIELLKSVWFFLFFFPLFTSLHAFTSANVNLTFSTMNPGTFTREHKSNRRHVPVPPKDGPIKLTTRTMTNLSKLQRQVLTLPCPPLRLFLFLCCFCSSLPTYVFTNDEQFFYLFHSKVLFLFAWIRDNLTFLSLFLHLIIVKQRLRQWQWGQIYLYVSLFTSHTVH